MPRKAQRADEDQAAPLPRLVQYAPHPTSGPIRVHDAHPPADDQQQPRSAAVED